MNRVSLDYPLAKYFKKAIPNSALDALYFIVEESRLINANSNK
jgi:hypothetical protein